MSVGMLDRERPDESVSSAAAVLSDASLLGFSSPKRGDLAVAAAHAILHLHRKETEG